MESMSHVKSPTHSDLQTGLISQESFDLFEEIVLEILLRLPVKSILKFRCVSKSWLSLLSSQHFIDTHVRVSTQNANLNGYRLMFTDRNFPPSGLMQCSVRSLLCRQTLDDLLNVGYPMQSLPMFVWMVGSCNGLICIAMDLKDLFLWNPSIKKSKKLPSMDLGVNIYKYVAYGFGFDESDDDYKVVGIFSVSEEGQYKHIMMVYGLKSDSWKRVRDLEDTGVPLPKHIKFASGKLHWWASSSVWPHSTWDIVCLDLESGVSGTVEQPDYEKGYVSRTLGVLGGCICVLCCDLDDHVSVWVLKEYGVRESWSRVFHFSCIDYPPISVLVRPLCLLPSGEILLVDGSTFLVCNPRYDSFTVLKPTKLERFIDTDFFVESLVDPDVK